MVVHGKEQRLPVLLGMLIGVVSSTAFAQEFTPPTGQSEEQDYAPAMLYGEQFQAMRPRSTVPPQAVIPIPPSYLATPPEKQESSEDFDPVWNYCSRYPRDYRCYTRWHHWPPGYGSPWRRYPW
jgi:hypothetical protein